MRHSKPQPEDPDNGAAVLVICQDLCARYCMQVLVSGASIVRAAVEQYSRMFEDLPSRAKDICTFCTYRPSTESPCVLGTSQPRL